MLFLIFAIKIGVILPYSGDLASYGPPAEKGLRLAVEEINRARILGDTIVLIIKDSKTSPAEGVKCAKELISQGVKVIIGAMSSSVTRAILNYVKDKDVIILNGGSTSPYFTYNDPNNVFFRTCPSDELQGIVMAIIARNRGFKTASILYIDNSYGKGLANKFEEEFKKGGGRIIAKVPYKPGKSSYKEEVIKAFSKNPMLCVLIGYPQSGSAIVREWLKEGYGGFFIFSEGLKNEAFIKGAGDANLEGMVGTAPYVGGPNYDKFAKMFMKKYGENPSNYVWCDTHYDLMMLLAFAMLKAKSFEPSKLKSALVEVSNPPGITVTPGEFERGKKLIEIGEDINYEGASGPVDFDENGDVLGTYEMWKISGGKIASAVEIYSPLGKIMGTVIDIETKQRIPNVEILIKELNIKVYSDINGEFLFKDVPAGTYTMIARLNGKEFKQEVTVAPYLTSTCIFTIKK